jgi:hypothetical protein
MNSANKAWSWTLSELTRKVEPMPAADPIAERHNLGARILAARSSNPSRPARTDRARAI